MKVAIVHDHLCQMGGAERVVAVLHAMFPHAPIYTAVARHNALWPELLDADIRTSWMQRLPRPHLTYRAWLPFYPAAIESFDLTRYDLILSSSSAFAKGAIARPGARHVCYCHTPMRYAWNFESYVARERFSPLTRRALVPLIRRIRDWDLRTRNRPSAYIANSTTVAERIRRCYGRSADIVHPPVGIGRYAPASVDDDFYVVVSRLVAYKRIDLAIAAFNVMQRRLVIVGDGPARRALQQQAGPTISFRGHLSDNDVAGLYARCRGLVFPGEEDFGIAPLEVNASGRPVIAYRAGGALDTVMDGRTGVFFDEQSVPALVAAVRRCEAIAWDKGTLRAHAGRFSEQVFMDGLKAAIERAPAVP